MRSFSLSAITVGSYISFSIVSRDEFSNVQDLVSPMFFSFSMPDSNSRSEGTYSSSTGLWNVNALVTQSGSFTSKIILENIIGIFATYYSDAFMQSPKTSRLHSTIDVDWGTGSPHSSLKQDFFSSRWAGKLRVNASATYAFHLYADDCASVKLEGRLLLDSCSTNVGIDCVDCIEYPGKYRRAHYTLLANKIYDLEVGHVETTGRGVLRLLWSRGSDQPESIDKDFFLSSAVVHIPSPNSFVVVKPDSVSDGKYCNAYGSGLTLATSGIAREFKMNCFDRFGNVPEISNSFFGAISAQGQRDIPLTLAFLGGGKYLASYSPGKAGDVAIQLGLVVAGGLTATYYDIPCCFAKEYLRGSRLLDLAATHTAATLRGLISNVSSFALRWRGLVQADSQGVYTFSALFPEDRERIKIWVDNSLILDSWSSLSSTSPSGTITLDSNRLYQLQGDYSHDGKNTTNSSKFFTVRWAYGGGSLQPIVTSRLFASKLVSLPRLGVLRVSPGDLCTTTSTANGDGLTILTVSSPAFFTIHAKDAVGNTQDHPNVDTVIRLSDSSQRNAGIVLQNASGISLVNITVRSQASAANLLISFAHPGGLLATFYDASNFTVPVSSRVDSGIDFSLAAGAKPAVSLTTGSPYSVRWSGFVRPQYAQVYTFFAGVQTAVERMKLWVNGYYDVVMEYKQPSGTGVEQGAKLSWSSPNDFWPSIEKKAVSASFLFQDHAFATSPFAINTVLCVTCVSSVHSYMSGPGISIMTAGNLPQFTLVARDAAGSVIGGYTGFHVSYFGPTTTPAIDLDSIISMRSTQMYLLCTTASCTVSNNSNPLNTSGWYIASAVATQQGGLHATYYGDSLMNTLDPLITSNGVISSDFSLPIRSYGWLSAKWSGFVVPEVSDTYTFTVQVECGDTKVDTLNGFRFLLKDKIMDVWNACETEKSVATYLLSGNTYRMILEYKYHTSTITKSRISVQWASKSIPKTSIPSARLFYSLGPVRESPFRSFLRPAALHTTSTSLSTPLTIFTAGVQGILTITARDVYGNVKDDAFTQFVIFARGTGIRNSGALISETKPTFTAGIVQTQAGSGVILGYTVLSTGLQASYYSGEEFNALLVDVSTDQIDFSLPANSKPVGSVSTGSPYSVRWSGFVRPQYAQVYTFFAGVQTAVERMKLWVDLKLVLPLCCRPSM